MAASKRLKREKAIVTVVDSTRNPVLEEKASQLEKLGIKTRLGEHLNTDLDAKDLIVLSPGVAEGSFLTEARQRKIPIFSEMELAYRLTDIPIIGVTGTNGKTTTATLLGEVFKEANKQVVVAGNIGYPLIESLDNSKDCSFLVVELSSFQLTNIVDFRPFISVLLNITQDHLDWHACFDEYVEAKGNIFRNQEESDFAVLNADDQIVFEFASKIRPKVIPFSKRRILEEGVFLEHGRIITSIGKREEVCRVEELKIKGEHNLDNAMATVAAACLAGVPLSSAREALLKFKGLAHRLEFVKEIDDVSYYNDSKATNPDATIKALTAFNEPIVLLLGGRNKGNSFTSLVASIKRKVEAVVIFGEAKDELRPLLNGDKTRLSEASSIEEATHLAQKLAPKGGVVLFSPACASFDMFSNFEERGETFKKAIKALKS